MKFYAITLENWIKNENTEVTGNMENCKNTFVPTKNMTKLNCKAKPRIQWKRRWRVCGFSQFARGVLQSCTMLIPERYAPH